MIEDLGVGCDTVRVRTRRTVTPSTTSITPPLFIAIGAISIFGILALASTGSSIQITTGKLGGKVVSVKLGTTK